MPTLCRSYSSSIRLSSSSVLLPVPRHLDVMALIVLALPQGDHVSGVVGEDYRLHDPLLRQRGIWKQKRRRAILFTHHYGTDARLPVGSGTSSR